MRDIRIVFMGTPDFAVASLKALIDQQYKVVGVITAPDKPAGRGRKINQSAVKKFAQENKLPLLQPTNLKNKDFLIALKNWNPTIQVVVAFRMLPKVVWELPIYGTFNLHSSLLPDYRGAAPIHWAIINGEKETGVSTFFIDDKIDTGEIIAQKKHTIGATTTVGLLHDRLMELGASLVVETVENISQDTISSYKQPEHTSKTAHKLHPNNCKIDWNLKTDTIYNKIRGLNPFPAAWTSIKDKEEVINAKIYEIEKILLEHQIKPGTIKTTKKEIHIYTLDGYINVLGIKLSGKRKMDATSLLNGFNFSEEAMAL